MMSAITTASFAALLASALLVSDEKSLFHIPGISDFRTQPISRAQGEASWPFSVDDGVLVCAWGIGQRMGYFVENADPDSSAEPRVLVLTVDPFGLVFTNVANRSLFKQGLSIEQLISGVSPYVELAERLCDQPPGVHVGGGEL